MIATFKGTAVIFPMQVNYILLNKTVRGAREKGGLLSDLSAPVNMKNDIVPSAKADALSGRDWRYRKGLE